MSCQHLRHVKTLGRGWRCAECGKPIVSKDRFHEIVESRQAPLGSVSRTTREQKKHTVYTESQAYDLYEDGRKRQKQVINDAGNRVNLKDVYYDDVVAAPVGEDIR